MNTSLQDICREARSRLNMTSQELSDASGIPFSSINNFFASASKQPSVYTAGPICRVLHVSMDRFFGIAEVLPPEQQMAQMQQQHDAELRVARMEGSMESMKSRIKAQRTLIIIMSIVLSLILSLLSLYVVLDYQAPDAGLIQGRASSVVGWVMILLLAVGVGVIAAVFLHALRYSKEHAPLPGK